ncbi:unnamed protein product [Microthlaspi erraticum]|uniref:KIB1-4 beta-propeller domain-containing protein n=1 Tax=Microthlaspi erraticum TaxID=1685480 RepID=A0A6D2J1U2_9BRAS|nr:unnamed protein product [Microthlaspi erraticum]
MGPRKKTPTMKWVVKSQQSTKMTEPATEKKKTSSSTIMPDSSLHPDFVLKLHLSSSTPSAKTAQQTATKQHTSSVPDWSHLPEELLQIISLKVEDCFDAIHARSVCRPWRSIFPFPSYLSSTRYSLPSFAKFPRKSRGFCTLEKFPMFLFRVRTPPDAADALPSEFYVGGINQDKSEDHIELPSPIQCSVKVKMGESDPTLLNMVDCQILPLGYQYRMIGYDPNSLATSFRGVAFLPLNKEGGGEFVVLIGYAHDLLALRSSEMKWMRVEKPSRADCKDIVTFRGKFYADFINGDVCVIDPYSLEATPLMPAERLTSHNYLVPSGDDELFVVERIYVRYSTLYLNKLACRVSRLDEEAGEWVVVSDLGDRVLFIGQPGNRSCSAKELPDGCGVSGDSMLFINDLFGVTFSYKYGVDTGNPEDDLSFWRSYRETRVTIVSKSPMAAHLRVDRFSSSSPGLGEANIRLVY